MQKKAAIEIQFNWIFVVIAGALILLFFVSVVTKQKKISDDKISSTILTDIESILTGAKISTGTVNVVDIPKREIKFECDKYSAGGINIPIRDKIIFSPDLIKGRKLITWALSWDVPFWITNFLYLTTPEVRYIIVDESESEKVFAEKIMDWLPDEINKEIVEPELSVEDKNNYRVKFVFVGQERNDDVLTDLTRMDDNYVTAIEVTPDTNIDTGTIKFFKKDSGGWASEGDEVPYLKKESLIGAIFAANREGYMCSMKKAFDKLGVIAGIHSKRSELLISSPLCATTYSEAVNLLDSMKSSSSDFTKDNVDGIYTDAYGSNTGLEHKNGAAQLFSCVLIY